MPKPSYRIQTIRAKGLWLVADQNGMCLRVCQSLKHAERSIGDLKTLHHAMRTASKGMENATSSQRT